jgi:iron(III) transport system substrate-binding protein
VIYLLLHRIWFRVAILVVLLEGCGGDGRTRIIVYSPHGKEMLSAFEQAYEARNPRIDVQWLDMGSQDAYDRIRTERWNPQADLWWGAPSLMFERAEQESLLERYVPTWDSSLSADFKSPNGFWYGTFITPEVLMYNNRVLPEEEVPSDWDDLLDPKWRGRIIIRYPLASGTMRIVYSAMIQRMFDLTGSTDAGFSWLLSLDANTKAYTADPTQLYLKIAREEGALTIWNLPDVIIQREVNGYPFGYRIPESGTPLIVDCIAIVRGTKNMGEAVRLYEFLTSSASMERQASEFYRIPARNDMDPSKLPDWLREIHLKPLSLDWSSIARNEREWMKRWDETVKGEGASATDGEGE